MGDNDFLYTAAVKLVVMLAVMSITMTIKAIASMENGPPVSAIFGSIFGIGAGINLGLWLMEKVRVSVPMLKISSSTTALVLCVVFAVQASREAVFALLRGQVVLVHVVGASCGVCLGVAGAPWMVDPPDQAKSSSGKKEE